MRNSRSLAGLGKVLLTQQKWSIQNSFKDDNIKQKGLKNINNTFDR